jgi:hypothetical protein
MLRFLVIASLLGAALPAFAADEALDRVMTCKGPDASMEIYIPETAVTGRGVSNVIMPTNALGYLALDLTEAEKGKHLEPVHVRLSGDRKFLIVEQYLRDYPATRIPVAGGTVDFDNRFGTKAVCTALNGG